MRFTPLTKRLLFALASLLCLDSFAEEVYSNVDFGNAVEFKKPYPFKGVLPVGASPDFAWTKSEASSERMVENGRAFIRFDVTKFDKAVMFQLPLLKPVGEGSRVFKFSAKFRSASPLEVQLRQGPPPYAIYFTGAMVPAGMEFWTEATIFANVDNVPKNANIVFFLHLKPGVTDIASVKLSSVSMEELQASIKRPSKSEKNFFQASRFPLGLPCGWALSREVEEGSAKTDESAIGPSGSPALKVSIEKGDKACLYSAPFQTSDPFAPNRVSFAFKSNGKWKASVLDDKGEVDGSLRLDAGDAWKTAKVDFKPSPLSRSFTVKFEGKGELWLDSLSASAGEDKGSCVSQGECEVALGLPGSDVSASRIQFLDEPAKFDCRVTGDIEGATLKFKVVNLYGEEKELPSASLGRSWLAKLAGERKPFSEQVSRSFDVFPSSPCGQFRIEAWAERDGARVSPVVETVATRIERPRHWNEDAPNSPFGCHFLSSSFSNSTMKAAGVNWVRLHDAGTDYIGWYHLEPKKGEWAFRDDAIQRYRDAKMKIFGDLQTAPLWASAYKTCGKKGLDGYFDRYFAVEDWDGWSNYVRTVCARYKGVVDGYFVWNEPCGPGFYHHGFTPGAGYTIESEERSAADQAKLCELASKAAKEVDPAVRISGANINVGGPKGEKWNQTLVDAGAYKSCDLADYHVYTQTEVGFPGDALEQNYKSLMTPLLSAGFKKPIAMSEGNGSFVDLYGSVTGMYKNCIPWEEKGGSLGNFKLSDSTCRFELSLLSLGVERVFLYSAHCYSYLGRTPNCLVLLCQDGYPHPALAAHSAMAWRMEDRKFIERVPVGDKVWASVFEGRGGAVAAISGLGDGKYEVPKNKELKISDLFGNPSDGVYKGRLFYVEAALSAKELAAKLR